MAVSVEDEVGCERRPGQSGVDKLPSQRLTRRGWLGRGGRWRQGENGTLIVSISDRFRVSPQPNWGWGRGAESRKQRGLF